MTNQPDGKVANVTGGSFGIGKAPALVFATAWGGRMKWRKRCCGFIQIKPHWSWEPRKRWVEFT